MTDGRMVWIGELVAHGSELDMGGQGTPQSALMSRWPGWPGSLQVDSPCHWIQCCTACNGTCLVLSVRHRFVRCGCAAATSSCPLEVQRGRSWRRS